MSKLSTKEILVVHIKHDIKCTYNIRASHFFIIVILPKYGIDFHSVVGLCDPYIPIHTEGHLKFRFIAALRSWNIHEDVATGLDLRPQGALFRLRILGLRLF